MNKIILYIAISKDGFIADINWGVDWLPQPNESQDIFGYKDLLSRVSTILMGRISYNQIITFVNWAWLDKQTYVFTSQELKPKDPSIIITSNSPQEFINK